VTHPGSLNANDLRYSLLVQPFRSSWIVVWSAPSLAALHTGRAPTEPMLPTHVYPDTEGRGTQP
jgi:hypothetical protein